MKLINQFHFYMHADSLQGQNIYELVRFGDWYHSDVCTADVSPLMSVFFGALFYEPFLSFFIFWQLRCSISKMFGVNPVTA